MNQSRSQESASPPKPRRFDDRAVAPAVGKTLEIGLGILVIALLTSTLYGSVVPAYRTAAGDELADRTLAEAITTTEATVPPPSATATAKASITLPPTIRGSTYGIVANGTVLELRHPHPALGNRAPLALPRRVTTITGTWRSTDPFRIVAHGNQTGVTITIGGPS